MRANLPRTCAAGALACTTFCAALAAAQPVPGPGLQLYGVVDLHAGRKQLASPGGSHSNVIDSGGLTTSFWGIRVNEALGNGLSAQVDLSGQFRADSGEPGRFTGDAVFSRTASVGLMGPWGLVRAGRITTPAFLVAVRANPFADSIAFAPYLLHTYAGGQPLEAAVAAGGPAAVSDSGYSNALAYTSPRWGGLQASVAYSFGEANSTAVNRRVGGSLSYEQGPLFAAYSFERVHRPALPAPPAVPAANQIAAQQTDQLALSWEFPVAKVFLSHGRTNIDLPNANEREFRTTQLGFSVPLGTGFLLASTARTTREQTALQGVRRSTHSLGYDHFLSRRTDLYVVAMRDELTGMQGGTTLAAGVRHRF